MKNYKELSTNELLKLNYVYLKNVECSITLFWQGDKMMNMEVELEKIRQELESR